jgi:hypothetical protein
VQFLLVGCSPDGSTDTDPDLDTHVDTDPSVERQDVEVQVEIQRDPEALHHRARLFARAGYPTHAIARRSTPNRAARAYPHAWAARATRRVQCRTTWHYWAIG